MSECIMLPRCGFIRKYQETKDLACRGFVNAFCRGAKQTECKRMQYREQHGCAPDDDMLPTGQMMPMHMRIP